AFPPRAMRTTRRTRKICAASGAAAAIIPPREAAQIATAAYLPRAEVPMSKNPAKDFGQIADDYAFFEAQSTEGPRDAAAFVRQLSGMAGGRSEILMLDFGCGTGSFTSHLLELLRWPPERLKLTLVEPVESARAKAVTRLAAFTTSEIVDSPALPADRAGQFDVVLSNHVLYYVPDLPARLAELIAAVAPGGLFTMALSGLSNTLIGIWTRAFEILGREMPYNVADDAEVA